MTHERVSDHNPGYIIKVFTGDGIRYLWGRKLMVCAENAQRYQHQGHAIKAGRNWLEKRGKDGWEIEVIKA